MMMFFAEKARNKSSEKRIPEFFLVLSFQCRDLLIRFLITWLEHQLTVSIPGPPSFPLLATAVLDHLVTFPDYLVLFLA